MTPQLTDSITETSTIKTSELRSVPGSLTLKWQLRFGATTNSSYYDVFLRLVGGSAKVKAKIKWSNDSYDIERDFFDGTEQMIHKVYYDREVTVTAVFTLHEVALETVSMFEFISQTKVNWSDAKIIIKDSEIKVNRMFLSMISPVFHAMFEHDSKESQTGVVEITDFTEEIVRNCIDVCFGKQLKNPTTTQIIEMLKFFDKYEMTCATTKLENWLKQSFTVENFSLIAAYAWQFSRKELKAKCGYIFYHHHKSLAFKPDIVASGPDVYMELVKEGINSAP